ncbi:P-loop containing nucleoside triphosphate hydrolase [Sesbania bispinosa]|nr:P-loop containing nucleoside triphosphate hydrolase [Sesbania bispinosa]
MKHFMLPRNPIARDAELPCSSSPSSAKSRPSRKHKSSSKENDPPSDPNVFVPSPSPAKLKSPLPPRPPTSNPLKRKLAVDTLTDNSLPGTSDSGVKVIVRMRPLCQDKDEGDPIVQKLSSDSLSINGQTFTFDSVADMEATQACWIFSSMLGCLWWRIAWLTGSGKTYTMWGPANALSEDNVAKDQQGLTPRVFERLFARISEEQTKHSDRQLSYQCHCSFLEIYNEQITDLLDPNQRNLQIREDVKSGVYVENLTEEHVSTMKDVTKLLIKNAADVMSRFKTSRINLVDLAGSERQKLTGAAGERLKEAGNINRSLSQLGSLLEGMQNWQWFVLFHQHKVENDNEMNTDDQNFAQPNEEKKTPSFSGSKCLNEESSCAMERSSLSCHVGEPDIGNSAGFSAPDVSNDSPSATVNCVSPAGLNIVKNDLSPLLKSPTPSVSPRISTSRKSLRTSSGLSPSVNDLHVESDLGIKTGNQKSSSTVFSSQKAPNFLTKTENLAASIRHGLEIIDSHQRNASLRQSSYRFSLRPRESRLIFPAVKVDVGVQTFIDDTVEEDSVLFTCSNCKNRAQLDVNEIDNTSNLQLVPVDCPDSVDKPKKLVLKAVEKVLAGSIRREMALEEFCTKQTSEIMQLNRLVQQYKHERECNAIIAQTREDKILRLESLMDGVLPTEEYMDEELVALTHEHKLLKEKYENHPEVLKMEIELKRVRDELEVYQNFYKLGEREVLMEEIQSLRSQLQFYIDSSSTAARKQYPLLQLTYSSEPSIAANLTAIPESLEERDETHEIPAPTKDSAEVKLEQERIRWTEAESRWISLSEELRAELEANRSLAEKRKQELDAERKCTEELQEAMHMAIEGHARLLEQYADLEEKHIQLLARHRNIQDGIEDVKKAASRAGVRGAESKFINALAAEISALKAEREKERRFLRDENRGLQAQLKDTAEAVQAAGELLCRLKEAEEAVTTAQKRAMDAEQEAAKAYKQIDKLKKKHEKEINAVNELLAEARLPKESVRPTYDDDVVMPSYDDESKEPHITNFDPFNNNAEDGELAKLAEPSWFSGYDRCNI